MTRLITSAEVKKHRDKNSLWIIIHNEIYDVTSYLEEHPGGVDPLLEYAGDDGTQAFEDVGHSDDARELLKKFQIGTLSPEDRKQKYCPHLQRAERYEKTWRTYDGSPQSRPSVKSDIKAPGAPRIEPRVQAITVPRDRRGPPCGGPSKLKWAVLALAGAIVIGFVLNKYLAKG